jgi:AraC-like DNA-binding protein
VHAARTYVDRPVSGMKEAFLITRLEAGRFELWTHGKPWRVGPGAIVLHQPGDVGREVSRDGPLSFQAICIAPRMVLDKARMQSVLETGDPRSAPFNRLHDAVAANADRLTLDCLLAEALGAMAALPDVRDRYVRPVRRALELVRARLADPITLDELAAHAGLDKFHLCRAFRSQIGMPPHAYLTRLRVLRAKELLAAGARPKDVAPQVGFYDQSQLNRHFRRIVGTTPGEFARVVHAPWLQVPVSA